MSYSSARNLAQTAKSSTNDDAIRKLAEAIHTLSRTVEQDIAKLERQIKNLK
jgi:serine/threonine protein kinase HipA of HipAB toxin-antitoxin module